VSLRSDLAAHVPYSSPRPWVPVRLDTNESPYPPPNGLRAALTELARDHSWHCYGDLDAVQLRARLAERHGHAAEGVWVAAGIWEILQQVLLAFAGSGRTVHIPEPTWGGYRHLAAITGTTTVPHGTAADVLVLCSPNNPTGEVIPPPVVAHLCQAHPTSLAVVDEAYAEFSSAPNAVGLLRQHPNLVVARSFSKALGLADLRLGYLLAHPAVVAGLERVRLPYHPSGFAQAAGLLALDHLAELQATIARVVAERERVVGALLGLRGRGVEPWPSQANFVCFAVPGTAAGVRGALLDRGVAVRDVSDQPGLAGHLRVTVGTPADNDAFDGQVEVALVSAPALGRRWWAVRGQGAWTTGPLDPTPRPLAVSRVQALSGAHLAYGDLRVDPWFLGLAGVCWRTRGIGDFLMWCLLADGAVDVVVGQPGDRVWDLAAPILLVQEAGGQVTDLTGRPWVEGQLAVASNGLLHPVVVDAIRADLAPHAPARDRGG